ncbi:MAG: 16S rRNA (guanine(966)-N(2))-methyltransferase RsmD [Acidimicrobiia bacterium]
MRIIAGAAKGRRLKGPPGDSTRPMMDRVKEAIFSSLGSAVNGARVLDLYAGSGSLGLEALSRGAESATFVEWRRDVARVLRENVDTVALGGVVVPEKVEDHLKKPGARVDLAFVDPPYDLALPSVEQVLGLLTRRLVDGAIVVLHRRVGSGEPALPPGLEVAGRHRYGDAEVTMLTKEDR